MQNVLVDPVSLKLRALVDRQSAGLYPKFFERNFYERLELSVALEGEEDDSEQLLAFQSSREVPNPSHLAPSKHWNC